MGNSIVSTGLPLVNRIWRVWFGALLLITSTVSSALESPTFTPSRGHQEDPVWLELRAEESGVIRYTLDGTKPDSTTGLIYSSPILVDSTSTVRAVSELLGDVSDVATHSYIFADDVLSAPYMEAEVVSQYLSDMVPSLLSAPTVSLTIPEGINEVDKRQVSLEFITPDGSEEFQVYAGIKQFGATSLQDPKPNLRLYFKKEFGPSKLEYPLFNAYNLGREKGVEPAEIFDQLELRQGSGDSVFRTGRRGTIIRNRLFNDLALAQGAIVPHGRYVQVFINSEYYGVYHLRERFNAAFVEHYFGGKKSDYEAVNRGAAYDGDGTAWSMVASAARESYADFRDYVDVNAYLDHMLLAFWFGMQDWTEPVNGKYHDKNWQAAGPVIHDSSRRWSFYIHDADNGLDRTPNVFYDATKSRGPAQTFYHLLQESDPDFITALSDRISANFFSNGPLTPLLVTNAFQRRVDELSLPIVADTARWGFCGFFCEERRTDPWDRDDEWSSEVSRLLVDFFPRRTDIVLDQFRAAGWFSLEAPLLDTTGDGVRLSNPAANADAQIWFTSDGSDPRLPGGAVSSSATLVSPSAESVSGTHIIARARLGDVWGPYVVHGGEGFIDAPPGSPLILNEWNAVDDDRLLDSGGAVDFAFGPVEGNGGDWFELVVTRSGFDLRGYRLAITEDGFTQELIALSDHEVWLNLPAGTIVTIAEDVTTDLSLDPSSGDWHINIRANNDGSNEYVTATNFSTSSRDWQLEIRDASGDTVFGPTGEGRNPAKGVGGDEIAQLRSDPTPTLQSMTAIYDDSAHSTFGAPNVWNSGASIQDFSSLRDPTSIDIDAPEWVDPILDMLSATTESIEFSWSAASDLFGVDSYLVSYQVGDAPAAQQVITGASVVLRTSVITGLPPGKFVDINVQAVDRAGNISLTGPSARFSTHSDFLSLTVDGETLETTVVPFSNQDNGPGNAAVVNGASGLSLTGNAWKKVALDYQLQRSTVLEFDFHGIEQGEVHGIGLETDDRTTFSLAIQLWGGERFGKQHFRKIYEGRQNETVRYRIPLGKLLKPKKYKYMTFISDNDRGPESVQSVISNISLSTEGVVSPPASDTELPVLDGAVAVSDISAHSARISWPTATDNQKIQAYEIALNGIVVSTVATTESTLIGLEPSTDYVVSVVAVDSSGNRSASSIDGNFTTAVEPPGLAVVVNGEPFNLDIKGFGAQDRDGIANLSADGITLDLSGNTWYYADLAPVYNHFGLPVKGPSAGTVTLQFSSSSEGGVHALALENNLSPSSSKTLKFFGYRRYGKTDLEGYALGDPPQAITVSIDKYARSGFRYLVFVNDHDVKDPTAQSTFSNVSIIIPTPET